MTEDIDITVRDMSEHEVHLTEHILYLEDLLKLSQYRENRLKQSIKRMADELDSIKNTLIKED